MSNPSNFREGLAIKALPDARWIRVGVSDESLGVESEIAEFFHFRLIAEDESVSLIYIIGTSLAFELALLSIACWIFVRRDY